MDLKTWKDVGEVAAVTILGGMLGIQKWREKKARRNGLLPNPKRCEDHEKRIAINEKENAELKTHVMYIRETVAATNNRVEQLYHMHLKE